MNPGYLAVHSISSAAQSATLSPLRDEPCRQLHKDTLFPAKINRPQRKSASNKRFSGPGRQRPKTSRPRPVPAAANAGLAGPAQDDCNGHCPGATAGPPSRPDEHVHDSDGGSDFPARTWKGTGHARPFPWLMLQLPKRAAAASRPAALRSGVRRITWPPRRRGGRLRPWPGGRRACARC